MLGTGDVIGCGALAAVVLGSVGSCLSESEPRRLATVDRSIGGVSGAVGAINVVGIASGVGLAVMVVDGETGGVIGAGCGVGVDTDTGCGAGIASIVCVPASSWLMRAVMSTISFELSCSSG